MPFHAGSVTAYRPVQHKLREVAEIACGRAVPHVVALAYAIFKAKTRRRVVGHIREEERDVPEENMSDFRVVTGTDRLPRGAPRALWG